MISINCNKLVYAFDYLFYRTYLWQLDQWKDAVIAVNSAGTSVGMLVGLNVLTFFNIITVITRSTAVFFYGSSKAQIVIIGLAWIFSFDAIYRKRHRQIVLEFENENEAITNKRRKYIWIYCSATFLCFIVSAIVAALSLPVLGPGD